MIKLNRNQLTGLCTGLAICLVIFMFIAFMLLVRNVGLKTIVQGVKAAQESIEALPTFDDVPPDHWAYEEIELIYSHGITVGCSYDPPLYCPDRPATRAELAVMLSRILEIIELKGE